MLDVGGGNGLSDITVRKDRCVERFSTQTQLIQRLSQLTQLPSLCIEGGSGAFFREFREYMSPENKPTPCDLIAIPPDPTDFLAFPCAADELRLALLMGGDVDDVTASLETLTEQYGLSRPLLNQPIRTLSGGERALVALAKAEALEPCYSGLVMASPVTWLHASRRHLVTRLCDLFESRAKSVRILLLDGDWPEIDGSFKRYDKTDDLKRVSWRLGLNGLTVTFPASSFPNNTQERTIRYAHQERLLELASPTLIQGENGIGKSSLALVLAGVLSPSEGQPQLITAGASGAARLLLQDTLRQMFGMSSADHVHAVYRYDQERRKSAKIVLEGMDSELRKTLAEFEGAIAVLDDSGQPSSLLHDKLALAVERLIARPNLLVLDEPSWGLSDVLSREFIRLVVGEAHKRGIPVAVISHESGWLEHLYNSCLCLSEAADGRVEALARVL